MKLIRYLILGLLVVSVMCVTGNAFAEKVDPYISSLGKQLQEFRKTIYDRGFGTPIEGYTDSSPNNREIFNASTMISSELRTSEGDYLAEIRDLVIDPSSGRISNVILDHLQMMGAKTVEIPFKNVEKTGEAIFIHRLPEGVYQSYSETPYWSEGLEVCSKEKEPAGSYRVSELMGAPVRTLKGEELGRIDDLVINSREGHIDYLVVSQNGMNGKKVVVPFSVLSKNAKNVLALNITKEQFGAGPAYQFRKDDPYAWKPPYGLEPIAEYNW